MLFVRLMLYSIAFYSRPEATNDVIVGQMVYWVSEGVCVKFGGSMSNISRDIWAAHFVTDEKRTTPADTGHNIRQNAILALCLKTAQMLHHVKQKLIRGGVISYCVHYCLKMSHNCLQENQQESRDATHATVTVVYNTCNHLLQCMTVHRLAWTSWLRQ